MPGDTMEQILDVMRKPFRELPDGVVVTPFSATNTLAVGTLTSVRTVKAAVTGKRHWITQAMAVDAATLAGTGLVFLQDEDDVKYAEVAPTNLVDAPAQPHGGLMVTFDPPVLIPAGKAIEVARDDSEGTVYLSINGYVEA